MFVFKQYKKEEIA